MTPTASIVIPVWNGAHLTAACLPLVRATLRPGDEVVVVDNGSADGTPALLREHPWVRVVRNAVNEGFAAGCNGGAAAATGDVIVFLNNDTLPVGGWLDDLLDPFQDPRTGATGPMSNEVSGAQHDDDPTYAPADLAAVRTKVRAIRETALDERVTTHRLVGFCLAVRRTLFEDLGGFDTRFGIGGYEDDDLCRRITARGHDLVIASRAFLHHIGHGTFDVNGLDWAQLELANERVLEAKRSGARPLSILVRCDDAGPDSVRSIVSAVDACAGHSEWEAEVVLVTSAPDVLLPVARHISGDVAIVPVADEDDEPAAWRRGLAEATGDARALLAAGDLVSESELAALVAAPDRLRLPTRVGRASAPVPAPCSETQDSVAHVAIDAPSHHR